MATLLIVARRECLIQARLSIEPKLQRHRCTSSLFWFFPKHSRIFPAPLNESICPGHQNAVRRLASASSTVPEICAPPRSLSAEIKKKVPFHGLFASFWKFVSNHDIDQQRSSVGELAGAQPRILLAAGVRIA